MDYGWLTRKTAIDFFGRRVDRIEGRDNLSSGRAFIIAANHNSWVDAPLLISALYNILKRKIYYIAATSWYQKLGAIGINKKHKGRVIEQGLKLLNNNEIVGIFPEGRANESSQLLSGKTGAARLALWSGQPVIPAGIIGTAERNPIFAVKKLFSKGHQVIIRFGSPINLNQISPVETTIELLRDTTRQIMQEIAMLCDKTYSG